MRAADTGSFLAFPSLAKLPALVRKQRKLAKELEPLSLLEKEEKATRDSIDKLLIAEGFGTNEGVTVNGYDVDHHERIGNQFLSREMLLAAGVALETLDACIDRHDPSSFASVKPTKGATVRK